MQKSTLISHRAALILGLLIFLMVVGCTQTGPKANSRTNPNSYTGSHGYRHSYFNQHTVAYTNSRADRDSSPYAVSDTFAQTNPNAR